MAVFSALAGSGSFATVAIDDLRNIEVVREAAEKTFASSSTNGQIKRVSGHLDERGSFDVYVDAAEVGPDGILGNVVEGAAETLVLKSSSGQTIFSDTAEIISITYAVPIEGGDVVTASVAWGRA